MKENKKKYPILEKAKKESKIKGAKGYTQYKTDQKNWELENLKAKLEMRNHIFQRIKKIYDADLALLEEAEQEYKTYIEEGKKTTK